MAYRIITNNNSIITTINNKASCVQPLISRHYSPEHGEFTPAPREPWDYNF